MYDAYVLFIISQRFLLEKKNASLTEQEFLADFKFPQTTFDDNNTEAKMTEFNLSI